MADAGKMLQEDVKLEPLVKEEVEILQECTNNEWNSTANSSCYHNIIATESFQSKREKLLLDSIKEEIKLEPMITENIHLKDEVILETSSESTTFITNNSLPAHGTNVCTKYFQNVLKQDVQLELRIKEETEIFSATTTENERSSANCYDTYMEKKFQNENVEDLVLKSIKDDIKLEPLITQNIILKDDISESSSENLQMDDASTPLSGDRRQFKPLTEEAVVPKIVTEMENNPSKTDCNHGICVGNEFLSSKEAISELSTAALAELVISKIMKDASKSKKINPKPNTVKVKVYYCPECSFKTHSRSTLRNHKIAKHTKIWYNCPQCPFKTKWKDYLQDHIAIHAGEEGKHLQCNLCDFKTALRTNLANHKARVHSTERRFECELCPYKAKIKDGLKRHMDKTHNKGSYFKCEICDYETEFKRNLVEHAKTHTGEKFLKCSECEYRSRTKRNLKLHMVTHSTQRSFECYNCGHKTKLKNSMIMHCRKHRQDKPYKCLDCGYGARLRYCLNQHLKKYGHTADVSNEIFTCNICDYVTSSEKVLKWHLRVHMGEKLFECHLCEYKTNSSSNFRKHEYIHEKRKELQ